MARSEILVADDDAAIRTVVSKGLTRAGFDVRVASNIKTLLEWVDQGLGDAVVSDVVMPDGEAFDILPQIQSKRPDLPVILISAQNTFMTTLKAEETGAYDYLPKPFDLAELVSVVERAISEPKDNRPVTQKDDYIRTMPLVGRSQVMQQVYRSIARLVQSDFCVMFSGESGTGKRLAAKVLHDHGNRSEKPFESINLAAFSPELIERELFGSKSADADNYEGVFQRANHGTLFIEEIGALPASAQARLLGVLIDGRCNPIGSSDFYPVDVRVISSTSRNLNEAILSGQFREDLFYRLSLVAIPMPALKDRLEDIPDLARHFLKHSELDGGVTRYLDQDALSALKEHSWPGNVRELENLIQRIATLYPQDTITESIVRGEIKNSGYFRQGQGNSSDSFESLRDATDFFLKRYFEETTDAFPDDGVYHRFLKEFEYPIIQRALSATNGNQIKAAEILGLNRNTLRKKINSLGINIVRTAK